MGILVFGHIGLTPQFAAQMGGYKAQGKSAEAAQKLLDEATEIHATPEVSTELAHTIAQGRKELEERMKSAQKLAHEEKYLREATRKQRFLFIGAIVLAVVLVALVATFVMRTL